ncbi:MAG: preprotein translocase subunit SecG [Prevotellaceae bacterium]|jgi:preprotein translocase subunit SecG|nr:preprotein translocase subunit SecG [Prevotellaceae bacterium]
MYITLTILIVILSIVLILAVLVQNSKGGGLASGFQSSNQILGVRKTTDFIEKATWSLVGAVVLFSIVAAGIHRSTDDLQGDTDEQVLQQEVERKVMQTPGTATPDFGEQHETPVQ